MTKQRQALEYIRDYARDYYSCPDIAEMIDEALAEPEQVPGFVRMPLSPTPEMRQLLLDHDHLTVGETYIMLLAAAPEAP